MRGEGSITRSLGAAFLLVAATIGACQSPPEGSSDREAREGSRSERPGHQHGDAGSHESRHRQIHENLQRWKQLDPAAREALRQRMRDAFSKGSWSREHLLENAKRLHDMSDELRQRMRERAEQFRKHREPEKADGRGPSSELREKLAQMEPLARKRYIYLRQLVAELSASEQEAIRALPSNERQKATLQLLVQKGPSIFLREVGRVSPAPLQRMRELGAKEGRQVFRRWLQQPSDNLRGFLRAENLLKDGDPPARGGARGQDRPRPGDTEHPPHWREQQEPGSKEPPRKKRR